MVEGYAREAVAELARRMATCGASWVLGGSTGLGMRGAALERTPRDIDIYADAEDARLIHAQLRNWATDEPEKSVTERYRSILSHYAIAGSAVELVGEFRISAAGSQYLTEVAQVLHPAGDRRFVAEAEVRLVPLGHELIFNWLRERLDRCELIGAMIRREPDRHLRLLRTLLDRNKLSADARRQICKFAGMPDE